MPKTNKYMVKAPFLRETTLTAIVRNEENNPAGGIVDYCRNVLPFVEKAVIIDTGSTDNTFNLLKKMKEEYPNLSLFQEEFKGFAQSRNSTLEKVKTKYSLILDADERFPIRTIYALEDFLNDFYPVDGLCFDCYSVTKEKILEDKTSLNPRFFKNTFGIHFKNSKGKVYEELYDKKENLILNKSCYFLKDLNFYHFIGESTKGKENWYSYLEKLTPSWKFEIANPEEFFEYELCKKFNPKRREIVLN